MTHYYSRFTGKLRRATGSGQVMSATVGGGGALESGLHTLCILPLIGGESKTIKRRTTVERLLVQKHL